LSILLLLEDKGDMAGVRFAPSPTGSFHVGNLRTAWISWKIAQKLGLPWVVRFEDIDQPRVVAGAQEEQLKDMGELGLRPDELVVQSANRLFHWQMLEKAIREGQVYPCSCSRKEIQSALDGLASAPHLALGSESPLYSGKCRSTTRSGVRADAVLGWRFRADDPSGGQDFIVARTAGNLDPASFVPSYHWACALDDFFGNYDLLVRAADLESATAIQRRIQSWIAKVENLPERFPAVFHTALVVQNDAHRLEKRTAGVTLKELKAGGWTPESILRRFVSSFASEVLLSQVRSGEILGEPQSSLTLRDLGFSA